MRAPLTLRVRRLAVAPLARLGATGGALAAAMPGIAAGALAGWSIHAARTTLEGWNAVRLPSPVPLVNPPVVSFVSLFHLDAALAALRAWDGALPVIVLAV